MANLDTTFEDFKANAQEIQNYCDTKSSHECFEGECMFYDQNADCCVFQKFGMSGPSFWTL
jgi:regulator of sigma D